MWPHQIQLLAPDGASHNYFGCSLAIYDNTAIVGAWGDGDGDRSGSAHVFIRNRVTWPHQIELLAPDDASLDYFGNSVGSFKI